MVKPCLRITHLSSLAVLLTLGISCTKGVDNSSGGRLSISESNDISCVFDPVPSLTNAPQSHSLAFTCTDPLKSALQYTCTFSGSSTSTVPCNQDTAGHGVVPFPMQTGDYVFTVEAVDSTNATRKARAPVSFKVDVDEPVITALTGNATSSNALQIQFTGNDIVPNVVGQSGLNQFLCHIRPSSDASALPALTQWTVCGTNTTSPQSFNFTSLQPSTAYRVFVVAKDVAGNLSNDPANWVGNTPTSGGPIQVTTQVPVPVIVAPGTCSSLALNTVSGNYTNAGSLTATYSCTRANSGDVAECSLSPSTSTGTFSTQNCTLTQSTQTLASLPDGSYDFCVRMNNGSTSGEQSCKRFFIDDPSPSQAPLIPSGISSTISSSYLPQLAVTQNRVFSAWTNWNSAFISCMNTDLSTISLNKNIFSVSTGQLDNDFKLVASRDLDQAYVLVKNISYSSSTLRDLYLLTIDNTCSVTKTQKLVAPTNKWFNNYYDIEVDNLGYVLIQAEMYNIPTNTLQVYAYTQAPNSSTFTVIPVKTDASYNGSYEVYGMHALLNPDTGEGAVTWQRYSGGIYYHRINVRTGTLSTRQFVDLNVSWYVSYGASLNNQGDLIFFGLVRNTSNLYEFQYKLISAEDSMINRGTLAPFSGAYYWDTYLRDNLTSVTLGDDFLITWALPTNGNDVSQIGVLNRISSISSLDGTLNPNPLTMNSNAQSLKMWDDNNEFHLSLVNGSWEVQHNTLSPP